ncbi:hypothetical protein EJB05_01577, partial [Eragrostis curvula]
MDATPSSLVSSSSSLRTASCRWRGKMRAQTLTMVAPPSSKSSASRFAGHLSVCASECSIVGRLCALPRFSSSGTRIPSACSPADIPWSVIFSLFLVLVTKEMWRLLTFPNGDVLRASSKDGVSRLQNESGVVNCVDDTRASGLSFPAPSSECDMDGGGEL